MLIQISKKPRKRERESHGGGSVSAVLDPSRVGGRRVAHEASGQFPDAIQVCFKAVAFNHHRSFLLLAKPTALVPVPAVAY